MAGQSNENNFEELLKSLNQVAEDTDTLAKAVAPAPDDKAVAAAAQAAGAAPAAGEGGEGGEDDDDEDDMVDATELVKSLIDRQTEGESVLAKAITGFTGALSKQNDLIKSLQAEVKALSGQGRGRKTVVNVLDKPGLGDLAKSQAAAGAGDAGITPADLLAKSEAAYAAGKLSGSEFNTVDVCLRNGWNIDANILSKVASA